MKMITLSAFCLLVSFLVAGQDFKGIWEGKIQAGTSLRIVLDISSDENGQLKTTLQSPDQSPLALPTDTTYTAGDSIFLIFKKYRISFKGKKINDNTIDGIFTQGADLPLTLHKVEKVSTRLRPQLPVPPFPYNSEDVTFKNADGTLSFAGTITWPKIPEGTNYIKAPTYPAVLLISGSGPQDRDESLMGHKPFLVLADYLTKKGFAVLRVDDRGVGKSTGKFESGTTADFADDAEAAFNFLKRQDQVDSMHVGLVGHSEGAVIAPMIAARRQDVGFIVLLAGPGIPSTDLLEEQVQAVSLAEGSDSLQAAVAKTLLRFAMNAAIQYKDSATINKKIADRIETWALRQDDDILKKANLDTKSKIKAFAKVQANAMATRWFKYFLLIDPQFFLTKLSCNVLAVAGSKDVQVLPASNLAGIKAALQKSKSPHFDVIEIPGLNHLFQYCTTCAPSEYAELEETFSPKAMELIANWMLRYGK